MSLLHAGGVITLALAALTAAWLDLRRRIVPNWLCAATALGGLAFSYATGGPTIAALALAHAVIALLIGMVLFALRLVGGGDAKFYAATAAWFSFAQGFKLLLAVALAGLVLTLVVWWPLRRRRAARSHEVMEGGEALLMVPYAVAIGAGGVLTLLLGS